MTKKQERPIEMPSAEAAARAFRKASSIDDFYGKDGFFARLFSDTMETMLEAEMTAYLGYEPHARAGRNLRNRRNGYYTRKMRTSGGDSEIRAPKTVKGNFTLNC